MDPYQTPLREVMEPVLTLPESATAKDVLTSLARSPAGVVLITAEGERWPKGIITRSDLVKFEKGQDISSIKAKDIASPAVVGVLATGLVQQALRILDGENKIKATLSVLPVVNEKQEVQGIVTRAGLGRFLESRRPPPTSRGSLSY